MKKSCVVLGLMLLVTCSLRAQDTLYSYRPPDNYHVGSNWYFDKDKCTGTYGYLGSNPDVLTEWAISCITHTPLMVYGLAAILGTERTFPEIRHGYFSRIEDTTTAVYEYLRLYEYVSDTLLVPMSEDLLWNELSTPVAYYLNTGLHYYQGGYNFPVFPVYECYFQTPVVVSDTFFMGHTCTFGHSVPAYYTPDGRYVDRSTCRITKINFIPSDSNSNYDVCYAKHWVEGDWSPIGLWPWFEYYYFFPILTLGTPDTTGVDTTAVDTLTIGSAALVDRYTSVFPNPAHGSTRVLSSFGLTRVEAYTVDGRKVEELRPTAYTADIDVSQWPAGEYLLRITTCQGTVTRKLLVR